LFRKNPRSPAKEVRKKSIEEDAGKENFDDEETKIFHGKSQRKDLSDDVHVRRIHTRELVRRRYLINLHLVGCQ